MQQDLTAQLEKYRQYLAADPGNIRLAIDTADLCNRLGETSEAVDIIDRAQEMHANSPELDFMRATIAMSSNQPELAISILRGLLDQQIDNPGIRYNLCYSLALLSEMQRAEEIIEPRFDQIAIAIPESYILLSRIKHHLGKLEEGIELVNQYLSRYSEHGKVSEAFGVAALLHLDNEDVDLASEYARKSISSDNLDSNAHITLGSIALNDTNADEAREYFSHVHKREPTNGRALLGLGLTEMLSGDLAAGEKFLQETVTYMPSHLGSWIALAWCQIAANNIDAAEDTLNAAMAINHNFSEIHGGLAITSLARGEIDDAKVHIKRGLGLDKNSVTSRYAKSILMARGHETDAAQQLLTELLESPMGKQGVTITDAVRRYEKNKLSSSKKKN